MIHDFPWTDMHELNLDWFLAEFKKLVEEWNQVQGEWTSLHDYVQNYFDNLNVQTEIDNKINAMIADGSFATIITPLVDAALPTIVDGKLPAVVASQIGQVVASQIGAVVAGQLPAVASAAAAQEVGTWLAAHIDPDTGYVIDDTMSVPNAAADAAAVGLLFSDINNTIGDISYQLNHLWTDLDYSSGIGYIINDGSVFSNPSTRYKKSKRFACVEGQKWYYKGRGEFSVVSWLLYSGDTISSYGQAVSESAYTEITIPNGIDGIVFCSYKQTTEVDNVVLDVKTSALSDDEKAKIQENIGVFTENQALKKFVSYNIVLGTNLFDGTRVLGEYVTDTAILTAANTSRSNIIPLMAGDYLVNCRKVKYGGNAVYIRLYDRSDNYIRTISGTVIVDDLNNSIMKFTLTDDCGVMFNVWDTIQTMLVRGDTIDDWPDSYVPYNPDQKVIDNDFNLNTNQINNLKNGVDVFYGKKIAADGDSISYGNGYLGGYAKIISEDHNMAYQNLSVGGATITAGTYSEGSPRHWVCRSMDNIATNADYILIEGGVNDSSLGVTLGSLTPGYTDVLDDTTFYGAVETIFKTLTTKYVGKKYGFIIPHRMNAGMYPNGNYSKAIKECGIKWGVKVLDLTESVPPFNQFRNTDDYDTIRNAYTTSGDGWHPTELCYREYYVPQIESFLKTL